SAHQLTLAVYRASKQFPKDEMFGLTSQMRRAVVSVEANMAEGFGRRSRRDFARFLRIADGSLQEVRCLLLVAADLGYLDQESLPEIRNLERQSGRLLGGLLHRLENDADQPIN